MHRLSQVAILNFRSCREVTLPLNDFTPLVGCNNAGKSNILTAVEWLLDASALTVQDFNDTTSPVCVSGEVMGIEDALVAAMPANQAKAIRPYVADGVLRLRRTMAQPGGAASAKLEVRDPAITNQADEGAWVPNPTGIQQALKALFPESIRIRAMEDAADDVGKQSKSNTIGRLVADVIEPFRTAHESDLRSALAQIAAKLSVDGDQRAEALTAFDEGASAKLADLFPGLRLKLDVPLPEVPELFKSGTVRVVETQGGGTIARPFDAVGHGAQRCIQMALIRYLAETQASGQKGKRTLLLIDEPELYLHPQGVEQVRLALKALSAGSYQVIFTTHSPLMLHREQAPHTVVVTKPDHATGTRAREPLSAAVREAIDAAAHQSRMLFELGNASEVFFSDRVLLSEGKTEQRLLPLLYEVIRGRPARADRLGLVPLNGSGGLLRALKVLKAMGVDGRGVADLDFAFVAAIQARLIDPESDPDVAAAKSALARLSPIHGFPLEANGFPRKDKGGTWTAAAAWAVFAKDPDGARLVEAQRRKLLPSGVWAWAEGTIEDVLGLAGKGEDAIQQAEEDIRNLSAADARRRYPAVADLFEWLSGPERLLPWGQ